MSWKDCYQKEKTKKLLASWRTNQVKYCARNCRLKSKSYRYPKDNNKEDKKGKAQKL